MSASGGWQQTLTDEDSQFLRGVNEGYRTWCLRNQKIQWLLRALECTNPQEQNPKVHMRVQQLKAMTIGQVEDPEDETPEVFKMCEAELTTLQSLLTSPSDYKKDVSQLNFHFDRLSLDTVDQDMFKKEFMTCLMDLGASASLISLIDVVLKEGSIIAGVVGSSTAICDLRKLELEGRVSVMGSVAHIVEVEKSERGPEAHTSEKSSETEATDTRGEESVLESFRSRMHLLDNQVDLIMEKMLNYEMDLKEFEQTILTQWQVKKNSSEYWSKRYAALTGMRSAMRAVLQRYEVRNAAPAASTAAPEPVNRESVSYTPSTPLELLPRHIVQGAGSDNKERDEDLMVDQDDDVSVSHWPGPEAERANMQTIHALSDVLAEGVTDPREREEILKREHAGSSEHPHGCRPCHFQGGLCWKGLSCSFCHICPKPKRKSKHQRDVDKRRQERYRQVKDDLGITCLDELTKVDDGRRQIMTSSEEMKKRIKDAYASGDRERIEESRRMVERMEEQIKEIVSDYNTSMPPEFFAGGTGLQDGQEDDMSEMDNVNARHVEDYILGEDNHGPATQMSLEQHSRGETSVRSFRSPAAPEAEDGFSTGPQTVGQSGVDDFWETSEHIAPAGNSPGKAKGSSSAPNLMAKTKGRGRSSGRGKYGQGQYPGSKGEMEGGKPWSPYYAYRPPYPMEPYWHAWGKKGPPPDFYWKGKSAYPGGPYPGPNYQEWVDPHWLPYHPGRPPDPAPGWYSDVPPAPPSAQASGWHADAGQRY